MICQSCGNRNWNGHDGHFTDKARTIWCTTKETYKIDRSTNINDPKYVIKSALTQKDGK